MKTRAILYTNIKYLCAKNGYNLGFFESEIGVSCGYFSRIKSGNINAYVLYRASKKLGISMEDLIEKDFYKEDRIEVLKKELKELEGEN